MLRPLLLPRTEAVKKRTEEERQRMDEGMTIAERVDTLRETYASEEKALNDYRSQTLTEIQKERTRFEKEKDVLSNELTRLKEERKQYFEDNPLDKQWLLYVKTEKERIDGELATVKHQQAENVSIKSTLEQKIQDNVVVKGELERQCLVVLSLTQKAEEERQKARKELKQAHKQSEHLMAQASKIKEEAERVRDDTQILLDNAFLKEQQLNEREQALEKREQDVLVKELLYYSPIKK